MTTYHFEPAPFAQLVPGDRIKLPQMYAGRLTGWWWPILTITRVDWIRHDHTALMLRLAEPLPGGDRFVLVAGRATVEAGVRRVVNQTTTHTTTIRATAQEAPMTTITAPTNAFAPYLTPGGGRVELTDRGPGNEWRYRSHCTGCTFQDGYQSTEVAHRHARKHAAKCWETPRLEGPMNEFAEALETVSPTAPMTPLAVRIGLAAAVGRPVTEREIDELPTIPEGATRADYARLLHQS